MDIYYKILKLSTKRDITDKDVRKAFHRLALKCHPDKVKEVTPASSAHFRLIMEARDALLSHLKGCDNYVKCDAVRRDTVQRRDKCDDDDIFDSIFS